MQIGGSGPSREDWIYVSDPKKAPFVLGLSLKTLSGHVPHRSLCIMILCILRGSLGRRGQAD
jgi:hypothetical protein